MSGTNMSRTKKDQDPEIEAIAEEAAFWRRDLHAHPELGYDVVRTADFVARRLREFGFDDVVTGLGKTGVVGVLKGALAGDSRVLAFRADMDALPIEERTNLSHASRTMGKMHACGHDGHTAMLLGAAKYLARRRDFGGSLVFIFQPAEEGGAGALAMIQDGLVEKFGITEFYGMHNLPGLSIGNFSTRPGPIMAATLDFDVTLTGVGTHAAMPHKGRDPIVAAAHFVTLLQTIRSRDTDPLRSCVVSTTCLNAGEGAYNVIPEEAKLRGTIRFFDPEAGALCERRIVEILKSLAEGLGLDHAIHFRRGYPVTVNDAEKTIFAAQAARETFSEDAIRVDMSPSMGAEDFSYMLEKRSGNFMFIGNGAESAPLHSPFFDFNDSSIPFGIAYWACLARQTPSPESTS